MHSLFVRFIKAGGKKMRTKVELSPIVTNKKKLTFFHKLKALHILWLLATIPFYLPSAFLGF